MLKCVLSLQVKTNLKNLFCTTDCPVLEPKGKIKVSPPSDVFHEKFHVSEDRMFVRLSSPVLASE